MEEVARFRHDEELMRLGLTLPGFVERSKVIASLPSLGLLTLAALTPSRFEVDYREVIELCDMDALPDDYDLVAVVDYGHAMIGEPQTRLLADRARFLAVTSPANAANDGYHTISKYTRADHFTLSEHELRLECRSPAGDLLPMLEGTSVRLGARTGVVTAGSRGCFCAGLAGERCQAPALATSVVDRSGAGEAFFALTSLAAVLQMPLELLAFLGNVAGAEAVAVPGNSKFIENLPYRRHVESLMK